MTRPDRCRHCRIDHEYVTRPSAMLQGMTALLTTARFESCVAHAVSFATPDIAFAEIVAKLMNRDCVVLPECDVDDATVGVLYYSLATHQEIESIHNILRSRARAPPTIPSRFPANA